MLDPSLTEDPIDMVDKRLKNYVNAIHYIKQNLISKPNFSDIKNNLLKNAELAHKIKKEL